MSSPTDFPISAISSALIARSPGCNSKGIFGVYSLREVSEYHKFWAIGSGSEFALGAMHVLYDRLDSAQEIAEAAVEAGCEFNTASGLPISFQVMQLDE